MIAIRPRNYEDEMLRYVRARIPETGDFVPSVLAYDIVVDLMRTDTELLTGWLDGRAEAVMTLFIGNMERQRRSEHRRAVAADFDHNARVAAVVGGDTLRAFRQTYAVDTVDTRRRVSDMTADDHRFVAGNYAEASNRYKMLAAFHKAIAERLSEGQKTSDVMSEDEYEKLYLSIVGR